MGKYTAYILHDKSVLRRWDSFQISLSHVVVVVVVDDVTGSKTDAQQINSSKFTSFLCFVLLLLMGVFVNWVCWPHMLLQLWWWWWWGWCCRGSLTPPSPQKQKEKKGNNKRRDIGSRKRKRKMRRRRRWTWLRRFWNWSVVNSISSIFVVWSVVVVVVIVGFGGFWRSWNR